jgi:hypothetical protein
MEVSELASDPELVPSTLPGFERSMRAGFIAIRVRSMLDKDPNLSAADAKAKLKGPQGELVAATARASEIATRVASDQAAGTLLHLDVGGDSANVSQLLVDAYERPNPVGLKGKTEEALKEKRKELVATISWWAMAVHEQLQQAGRIDDLHMVVDRRLRVVERMLYYVADGVATRRWKIDEINAAPGGPWQDGTKRIFEYPFVPRRIFGDLCDPVVNGACQGQGMAGWDEAGFLLERPWQVSGEAQPYWEVTQSQILGEYPTIFYKTGAGSIPPTQAIDKVFKGSTDFKKRNLLACDQVIHLLHIEGLVFALVKRNRGSEFDTLVSGKPAASHWLRVDSPWNAGDKGEEHGTFGAMPFIANPDESAFFEHKRVRMSDIQLGDHLIVYNHPAYDRLVRHNTWRLENAMVVQLYPKPLVQGHGMLPKTVWAERAEMLELCNKALARARTLVEEALETPPATTGFPTIPAETRRARIVRRVPPGNSQYTTENQKADWWVCWIPGDDKGEAALANSTRTARRNAAWNEQKVEFVTPWDATATLSDLRVAVRAGLNRTTPPAPPATDDALAFFPLWQPGQTQSGVKRNPQNKIDRIHEVEISQPMISFGGWYIPPPPGPGDPPEPRDTVTVIRPKV